MLPFSNLSGDAEQEHFADALTEDIITGLARFRDLFVISSNSSFRYKGRAVDIKQVGRELGVRFVLEGSVRRSEDRLRVTTQLIDAVTDEHLWAETYDRELTAGNYFEVQDEITEQVIAALGGFMASSMRALPVVLNAKIQIAWKHMICMSMACIYYKQSIL